MTIEPLDETKIAIGLEALAGACPRMARLIGEVGAPAPRIHPPGFASLARIMVGQQLSVSAAAAIWRRFEAAGGRTPQGLAALSDRDLRAIGFSAPKIRYVRALARRIEEGFDLDALARSADREAIAALRSLDGVGPWTAEIYLVFALGRTDVMPAGDLALQIAARDRLGLAARPKPDALRAIAEPWRPWRSVAALVLWKAYGATPSSDERS